MLYPHFEPFVSEIIQSYPIICFCCTIVGFMEWIIVYIYIMLFIFHVLIITYLWNKKPQRDLFLVRPGSVLATTSSLPTMLPGWLCPAWRALSPIAACRCDRWIFRRGWGRRWLPRPCSIYRTSKWWCSIIRLVYQRLRVSWGLVDVGFCWRSHFLSKKYTGWWFQTFFISPYIRNYNPNWLSYFSEG